MSTNDPGFDDLLSVLPVNQREQLIKSRAEQQAQFAREQEDRKQQAENELRELKKKSEEELAAKRVIWQEATRQRQIEQQKADANSIELERQKSEYALRGLWKDQYEAKIQAVQSVVHNLPPEKRERVMQLLGDSGLGNDTVLLSHLASLAQHRATRKGK